MTSLFLEIERLRNVLRSKGLDEQTIASIVQKAEVEISNALRARLNEAMELAIQSGVQKGSADFINELRPREDAFILDTESGITDFSDPPFPMLDRLLASGAKPLKDGSGVYKVIPVGGNSIKPKQKIHTNIFDAQRAISAERYENAVSQYNKIAPQQSKANFKTATSKQNRDSQWVMPAKEKDFSEDLAEINSMLHADHDSIIMDIIKNYEDSF